MLQFKKFLFVLVGILAVIFLLAVGGSVEAAKSTTANLYKEAVSLNKKGKIYRASYKFSQFIDSADLNNDATNYKMKALLAQNVYDDEGAVSSADKVIAVKNKKCNSDILGLIYKNLGQIDLAEKNFNLAISSSQQAQTVGYWKPYLNMGSLRAEQNDYEVASKYYLKAVEVAPDDRFVNSILGGFFYDNEKYVQAIIYYDKAVKLGTNSLGELQRFADSYFMIGQLDEAKNLAEKILLLYPNSKGTILILANIYGEMGLTKEADEMTKKADTLPAEN